MLFPEFCAKTREARKLPPLDPEQVILSFDPGHTTGWCAFTGAEMDVAGQLDTDDISKVHKVVNPLLLDHDPEIVVMEDYRVYRWRQKHHVGSEMLTTRVIGAIETLALLVNPHVEIIKQPAHVAKGFVTDTRLKEWGLYRGHSERHARDAIRHATYFLCFGALQKKRSTSHVVG